MAKRMFRSLLGITCIAAVFYFPVHFSLFTQESYAGTGRRLDYMGLDGELTFLPLRCTECCLIGSSGHLLKEELGAEIDKKCPCIFRLGFSPSRGIERFVGSRTTVRVVDSFSFYPFLKKPLKLVAGPYTSDIWVLFDRRTGDIVRFHQPSLSSLVKKDGTKFLWLSRPAERAVYETVTAQASNLRSYGVSGLWFSLKAAQDAGCKSLDIYGIPDHQICKRDFDVSIRSLYWDNASSPICRNGVDASYQYNNFSSSSLPRVYERKALLDRRSGLAYNVRFIAPPWPS